jgi:hypothetical protein
MRRTRDRALTALAAAGLIALATAGCGAGKDEEAAPRPGAAAQANDAPAPAAGEGAAPSGPDPCTLLTPAEIEKLLTVPYKPSTPTPSEPKCTYIARTSGEGVSLTIRSDPTPGKYDDYIKTTKADLEPVKGVGQRAVAVRIDSGVYWLTATNGRYTVDIMRSGRPVTKEDQATMAATMNRVLTSLA